jgi:hypothetical protein
VVAAEAARRRLAGVAVGLMLVERLLASYLTVGAVSTPPDIAEKLGSVDAIDQASAQLIEDEPAQLAASYNPAR